MKAIIFDSSTLISFSMNGLLNEIENLKKIFKGKFIIPHEVKKEIIDKPMTIRRFELEAVKLQQLLDEGILESPKSIEVSDEEISNRTKDIMNSANSVFEGRGKPINIIDLGEAACLALSEILTKKGVKNIIAIDERTTRMLCEKPENLINIFHRKLHAEIRMNKEKVSQFKGFKFIRSAELVYVAYKKGVTELKGANVLDALLWAVKFKGCSISEDEIRAIKKI